MATKEELALQDALLNTYKYNLRFLSQYDPTLFQRVSALDEFIANGTYKERYFLEFIKENGDFDIFDDHTKTYIYNKKPKQWNNKAIQNTNFDTEGIINLLNPKAYNDNMIDLSERKVDNFHLPYLKLLSDIKNYQQIKNEKITKKIKKVKHINKFLFMGTLLGRHIPKIIKKLQTTNHFVCESNLEIFRLSLFVCDYSLLARDGKSVVFSIMEDESLFIKNFSIFFSNQITENTFFKYFSTNYNLSNYFDNAFNVVLEKDPFVFDYRLMLELIINNSTKNFNKYKTLNFTKISQPLQIVKNKKILFVGAGPSLGHNIKWLQKYQNKFIIVAMAASLKKLTQANIKPDIITTLDPQETIIKNQFNAIDKNSLNNTIKFISLHSHNEIFKICNENTNNLYTFETLRSFQKNNPAIDGISIGEVTLKILLNLQIKELYLLGIDLALDQKTGHTHIDTHGSYHEKNTFTIDKDKQDNQAVLNKQFSLREDTILVKGNFIDKVTTTRLFTVSLLDYNETIAKYPDVKIYNLSQNGAYIQNTIPTKIDDLDISNTKDINKNTLHKTLIKELDNISSQKLENEDKQNIKNELFALKDIIENLNRIQKIKIKSYDEFKTYMQDLKVQIFYINSYSSFLPEIYLNFHFIINRYIDYVFNNRHIKDDKQDIKEIQHIWCEHLKYIVNQYDNYLNRLL